MATEPQSQEATIVRLRAQLAVLPSLRGSSEDSPEFKRWLRDTRVVLERSFGRDDTHVRELGDLHFGLTAFSVDTPEEEFFEAFDRSLERAAAFLESVIAEVEEYGLEALDHQPPQGTTSFIAPERLRALRAATSTTFDLSRLVRIAEEIDASYRQGAYHAVAALTRALLDHVPPLFNCRSFAEVANNYGGTKSFRQSMEHLETSARRIADAHLHTQIRARETLPTATQVNFSNDLDVLLAEIVRILP